MFELTEEEVAALLSQSVIPDLNYVGMAPTSLLVGLPDEEDDFNFGERFAQLKAEFEAQLKEEARLNTLIAQNLTKVKV